MHAATECSDGSITVGSPERKSPTTVARWRTRLWSPLPIPKWMRSLSPVARAWTAPAKSAMYARPATPCRTERSSRIGIPPRSTSAYARRNLKSDLLEGRLELLHLGLGADPYSQPETHRFETAAGGDASARN